MTQKHGSPTFYKLIEEMAEIHDKKSHDYASNENPYGNYHFAGQVSTLFAHSFKDAGFVGRIAEKIYRLANLESSQKTPQNESIEDTERDIITIACLWMADRRDRRNLPGNYKEEDALSLIIRTEKYLKDDELKEAILYLIEIKSARERNQR